jgi:PAS domain S-box-containing protein
LWPPTSADEGLYLERHNRCKQLIANVSAKKGIAVKFTSFYPTKFSSRLFIMTCVAGLIPVMIFLVILKLYGGQFRTEITDTIQQGYKEEWRHSELVLREQLESSIRQKSADVALQLDLVLQTVPWMTLKELQKDTHFRDIAVQPVGQTGYTFLFGANSAILRFHPNRKYENRSLKRFARELPAFWSVMRVSLGGKQQAAGYYEWKETTGDIRHKYMVITRLNQPTSDGAYLSVAATAYLDEFTVPLKKAQGLHASTLEYLTLTINRLMESFRVVGFLFMGLGILAISLLAAGIGMYFSRSIVQLREATRRINEGDFGVRVKASMSGEVGTLTEDFNRMVAQLSETTVSKQLLEKSEERLKETNAELLREINVRRRAEEALAGEKERLAVTLSSIGEGVISADSEGAIVLMNPAAERLTGWSAPEAIGKNISLVLTTIDETTRKRCADLVETVIKAGATIDSVDQKILVTRSGAERIVADSAAPIYERDGTLLGVVIAFRDMTEKRKLEEELLKVKKLESIGLLAGGIAHDFNNLLAVILGNISFGKMLLGGQERIVERLTEAEKACQRAKELTGQLLTFSKGGEPVRRVMLLPELIIETVSLSLSGSNVKCSYEMQENLTAVEIDETQIRQVIHNLAVNAHEAMPSGGNLRVRAENVTVNSAFGLPLKEGVYIRISVEDEGIGIPEEDLQRLFDPYFTTKEMGSQKGMGLGLTICYSIVKNHEGFMTVTSKVGEGTTFDVYLPAFQGMLLEAGPAIENVILGKGKILYMDDEDSVRDIAGEILTFIGYSVQFARDGEEAVALYKQAMETSEPFSAVIMDLTIPGGMGGKEAVKKLTEIDPEVKAIVTSGYSNDPIVHEYLNHGFAGVILKPYNVSELGRVVGQIVEPKSSSEQHT